MKTRLVMLMSLGLVACGGGSWSNRDLEFIIALPAKEDLKTKLPKSTSTSTPLEGPSTRRDGLEVGDPSKAYADTKAATDKFNGVLDFLLGVLDTVRTIAPTTRTADTRTWGPFADTAHPGFQTRVTITEHSLDGGATPYFSWAIDSLPSTGAAFSLVTGTFDPSVTAKKGRGAMVMHVKDFRDVLNIDDGMKELDAIDISYDTSAVPVRVDEQLTYRPASVTGLSSIGYHYRENADRSGTLTYQVTETSAVETEARVGWLASGEGRQHASVLTGPNAGLALTECWNASFKVTYYTDNFDSTMPHVSGSEANCVTVEGY